MMLLANFQNMILAIICLILLAKKLFPLAPIVRLALVKIKNQQPLDIMRFLSEIKSKRNVWFKKIFGTRK